MDIALMAGQHLPSHPQRQLKRSTRKLSIGIRYIAGSRSWRMGRVSGSLPIAAGQASAFTAPAGVHALLSLSPGARDGPQLGMELGGRLPSAESARAPESPLPW